MTGVTNDATGSRVTEYRTDDGGRTWQATPITAFNEPVEPAGSQSPFVFATQHFVDESHGRIWVGRPSLSEPSPACTQWLTLDGGHSWTRTSDADPCFVSPKWVTPGLGYVANGSSGPVWVTQDGGASWRSGRLTGQWSSFVPRAILPGTGGGITMVASAESMVCTQGSTYTMPVLNSTDGSSWGFSYDIDLVAQTVEDCFLAELTYGGVGRWTAFTDNWLRESRDGGRTWTTVGTSQLNNPQGLAWWDDRHGILQDSISNCEASSGADCNADFVFFVTSDGGRTWHRVVL